MTKSLLYCLLASTSLVGCLQPGDDPSSDTDGDESSSSQAVTKPICGPTPKEPTCNIPKCTADGWVVTPSPLGNTCPLPGGGLGMCDGGGLGPTGQPKGLGACGTPGAIDPQYHVMKVIYSPPGFGGDASKASSVTYSSTTSTSHDTKTTQSFKQGVSVNATLKLGALGLGLPLSIGGSSSWNVTQVHSDDEAIVDSDAAQVAFTGDARDGIDHDNDQILVWLNPRIVTLSSPGSVWWDLELDPDTHSGADMNVLPFRVGDLRNPAQMNQSLKDELAEVGVTPDHYADLIAYDPLANNAAPDPTRFKLLANGYWYLANAPQSTDTLSSANTTTATTSVSDTKTVGLTATFGPEESQLAATGSMEWTTTNDDTIANGVTETASFTIKGPSATYSSSAPSELHVYYDTLYKTFAFSLVQIPQITGSVYLRGAVVTLVDGGHTYTATSDMRGFYKFDMVPVGPAKISAVNQTKNITVTHVNQEVDFSAVVGR